MGSVESLLVLHVSAMYFLAATGETNLCKPITGLFVLYIAERKCSVAACEINRAAPKFY